MKLTYISPIICFNLLMLYQLVNDLFPIKLSSDFEHTSNIPKLWEDIPKLVVFSIILARPVTILSVVGGITRMKKIYKRIIFESDREYVKDLILKLYFSIKKQQQQQTTKNKSKPRHYLHNNLRLTMVFLRCSFENSIINRLAVKYLYSFTFVYGIWKQQIQETN
jgi:hypothetical protein